MTPQSRDLKVLICEDEYLLASDMAAELGSRGIDVAGIMSRVADVQAALNDDDFAANAAVLDVKLLDGETFGLVAPLRARGVAVVFCTGYAANDLPAEFADFPKVGKPTDIDELLGVLMQMQSVPSGPNDCFAR